MYLFVYGTLKRGAHPMADELWSDAEFAGTATVQGALYDMGHYPALVDEPRGCVHGELALLLAPGRTLAELDCYEGDSYQRCLRPAALPSGDVVEAMVYVYRGSVDGAKVIPSGSWG